MLLHPGFLPGGCADEAVMLARQHRALLHQFAGHAERGAGRQDDLHHRAGFGIVIALDQAQAVFQNCFFAIHNTIRWQPALALAQAHRPARCLQADAHFLRRGDFVIQPGSIREKVKMVGCGGAPRKRKLGQRGLRGKIDIIWRHACPDRVKGFQPVEEVCVLGCRNGAGQCLVKMMVGIDQPGQNQVPVQVQDLISCLRQFPANPHLFDESVPDKNTTTFNLPAVIIHGY